MVMFMARRSRIKRAGKASARLKRVDGLDHPEFAESYFKRARRFGNEGEAQLDAQERMLRSLDRRMRL